MEANCQYYIPMLIDLNSIDICAIGQLHMLCPYKGIKQSCCDSKKWIDPVTEQ